MAARKPLSRSDVLRVIVSGRHRMRAFKRPVHLPEEIHQQIKAMVDTDLGGRNGLLARVLKPATGLPNDSRTRALERLRAITFEVKGAYLAAPHGESAQKLYVAHNDGSPPIDTRILRVKGLADDDSESESDHALNPSNITGSIIQTGGSSARVKGFANEDAESVSHYTFDTSNITGAIIQMGASMHGDSVEAVVALCKLLQEQLILLVVDYCSVSVPLGHNLTALALHFSSVYFFGDKDVPGLKQTLKAIAALPKLTDVHLVILPDLHLHMGNTRRMLAMLARSLRALFGGKVGDPLRHFTYLLYPERGWRDVFYSAVVDSAMETFKSATTQSGTWPETPSHVARIATNLHLLPLFLEKSSQQEQVVVTKGPLLPVYSTAINNIWVDIESPEKVTALQGYRFAKGTMLKLRFPEEHVKAQALEHEVVRALHTAGVQVETTSWEAEPLVFPAIPPFAYVSL